MLHRLRAAMVRPGRDRLSGVVEMDDTLLGGVRPGGKGGRTLGEKILVGVAIERRKPRGFGRCRLAVLPDASTESLGAFLAAHVEPGSTVVTDGWQPYKGALQGTYGHERYVAPGRLPTSCSLVCIASPACSTAGSSPPTRARSKAIMSRGISMSSASASTGGHRAPGACSSTACSSKPSRASPCHTDPWSSTRSPEPAPQAVDGALVTPRPRSRCRQQNAFGVKQSEHA